MTTTMLPALIAALTMLIEGAKRKESGFTIDTVATALILSLLGFLELVLTTTMKQDSGYFFALFIVVLLACKIFIWGNIINFTTGLPTYTIQQKLEQILIDNKMDHLGIYENECRRISILNKYQSIVVTANRHNSDKKTVAFKGTWRRKEFRKISTELMNEIKGDLLIK